MSRKTYPAVSAPKPTTLILACPDPRLQQAVHRFIHEELKLTWGEYILLGELGAVVGVSVPSETTEASHEFRHLKDALEFCFTYFPSLNRKISINHDRCARYGFFHKKFGPRFLTGVGSMLGRQVSDLALAGHIAEKVSGKTLVRERYQLRFANPERTEVFFEPV